jgi:hypothetical protein
LSLWHKHSEREVKKQKLLAIKARYDARELKGLVLRAWFDFILERKVGARLNQERLFHTIMRSALIKGRKKRSEKLLVDLLTRRRTKELLYQSYKAFKCER